MPGNSKQSIKVNCYFKLDRRKGTVMACQELIIGGHVFVSPKIATCIEKS